MSMNHATATAAGRTGATILMVVAAVTLAGSGAMAAVAAAPHAAAVQSGQNLEKPPTWKVRYDDRSAGERAYEVMRPGWHVHSGPAGILWDDGRFAAGNYSVASTIFLFPAGQGEPPSQVEAPYGLLLAGEGLEGSGARYVSFMLRNDGSFRVARHTGNQIQEIVPWTASEAIATWTESTEGTAKNLLAVDATIESVTFWVNDEHVASLSRAELPMDGIVGLRAGADVSLHITDIAIGPNRR